MGTLADFVNEYETETLIEEEIIEMFMEHTKTPYEALNLLIEMPAEVILPNEIEVKEFFINYYEDIVYTIDEYAYYVGIEQGDNLKEIAFKVYNFWNKQIKNHLWENL